MQGRLGGPGLERERACAAAAGPFGGNNQPPRAPLFACLEPARTCTRSGRARAGQLEFFLFDAAVRHETHVGSSLRVVSLGQQRHPPCSLCSFLLEEIAGSLQRDGGCGADRVSIAPFEQRSLGGPPLSCVLTRVFKAALERPCERASGRAKLQPVVAAHRLPAQRSASALLEAMQVPMQAFIVKVVTEGPQGIFNVIGRIQEWVGRGEVGREPQGEACCELGREFKRSTSATSP